MVINVSVQYNNGGLLPDIILLTQGSWCIVHVFLVSLHGDYCKCTV